MKKRWAVIAAGILLPRVYRRNRSVFARGLQVSILPHVVAQLYAMTSELAKLQPFLIQPAATGVQARVIDDLFDPPGIGVRSLLLSFGDQHLLILVNEDDHRHLGVDVMGLDRCNGRTLELLYGAETAVIRDGSLVTRMQPHEVKLFATQADRFESSRLVGRNYGKTITRDD